MIISPATDNTPTQHTDSAGGRNGRGRGFVRQALDAGIHPATRRPLATGQHCGGCAHLQVKELADASQRLKCALVIGTGRRNGGPDLHEETPACAAFKAAPLERTNDGTQETS
ncbi:hypothetical protein ACFFSH_28985 [Streptomyces filamentosus]|uniref:Uncharacterized protein n=1 Tax=Streptomyces filamentosus TaxID=67294 RepID=A0A919ES27_STRFL|nr:hypothetical protein [Streptomyces filamentosus]GHG22645.1 hypothetical protein GCM10017667_68250 [Streptomyces filamentosus]